MAEGWQRTGRGRRAHARQREEARGAIGESEHKILLTASRPNLIPRAELGENVERQRDCRGCSWRKEEGLVDGAGLVEINLPVDGSPPLGLESTFAPTLHPSGSLFSTPSACYASSYCSSLCRRACRYDRHPPLSGPLARLFVRRKDHLINSPRLVINSTLVGHEQPTDYRVPETNTTITTTPTPRLDLRGEMIG